MKPTTSHDEDPPGSRLRAGELARLAGVSTDTLRHYERKGVLPAPDRQPNGYRSYDADTADRLRVVRAALALGFTLDELARIFAARDRGRPPCRAVRELAGAKLVAAEERLRELERLVTSLRALLAEWDQRLRSGRDGEPLRLLERLPTPPIPRRRSAPLKPRRRSATGEP